MVSVALLVFILMAGAVFGVLFVLQASKNMAGNVICEVLLLTRHFIVARPAIASFGRACLHPWHCVFAFDGCSCCVNFLACANVFCLWI